jgi:hypothetical protein
VNTLFTLVPYYYPLVSAQLQIEICLATALHVLEQHYLPVQPQGAVSSLVTEHLYDAATRLKHVPWNLHHYIDTYNRGGEISR